MKSVLGFFAPFLLLVLASLSSTSCMVRYVVLRDVPESPIMTVIPASVEGKDVVFADKVQAAVIASGMKVIERPAMIAGQTFTDSTSRGGALTADGRIAAMGGKSRSTITESVDIVGLYEVSSADYILIARSEGRWVRLVQRETKEVLFSGSLPAGSEQTDLEVDIKRLLVNASLVQDTR